MMCPYQNNSSSFAVEHYKMFNPASHRKKCLGLVKPSPRVSPLIFSRQSYYGRWRAACPAAARGLRADLGLRLIMSRGIK